MNHIPSFFANIREDIRNPTGVNGTVANEKVLNRRFFHILRPFLWYFYNNTVDLILC
jgi:hypothetical protein